mgnify:CR=1 FL=1
MIDVLKGLIRQFMPFAQEKMGFDRPPKLFLRDDPQNAANPLGKTGFYDPEAESVTLYTTGRHPKDIMRSLAHELMHHTQKCNGDFDNVTTMGEEGYAQSDPHMRTMEIQAYQASIVFRDWEDSTKGTIYYEHLQKGDKSSMSTKNWKNGELKSLLSEAWGFKMDLSNFGKLEEYSASGVDRGPGDDPEEEKEAKQETEGEETSKREEEGLDEAHDKDWGMGKDEDSRTRPGEKDYTGHKGDESHTHPGEEDYEGGAERPEDLAQELMDLAQRMSDAVGASDEVEELEEGEGDRGDKDREQGRDAGREHRADSSGKGVSEAQVRRIIAKVLKERRKKGK